MVRYLAILFFVILSSTEILGTLELIRQFITNTDANITRVRTLEELHARSDEFVVLDFIGLVERYEGYTAEEYDVQTKDGYILKLHRMSGSPLSPKAPGKPVVYLQHGLVGSSDYYVVMGPEQALAFQLVDAGYDLWLGNVRGSTYSKKHVKYSSKTDDKNFWNFSMDEQGIIDIAKFIDFVLEKTNQQKLTYIGYSMGTTLSYMLLSEKPEYNDKMNLVIDIAPVAYFTPPHSQLVNSIKTFMPAVKVLALASQIYQILPQSKIIQIFGKDICTSNVGKLFCENFMKAVVSNFNSTALPTILAYTPAGTSLNTLDHYHQMIVSGKFRKYNFGVINNALKYGSSIPPDYDLIKITSPHAIFYSADDVFVTVKDAIRVGKELKNVVAFEKVPVKGFNHLDFLWNVHAKTLVYDRLIELINKFAR